MIDNRFADQHAAAEAALEDFKNTIKEQAQLVQADLLRTLDSYGYNDISDVADITDDTLRTLVLSFVTAEDTMTNYLEGVQGKVRASFDQRQHLKQSLEAMREVVGQIKGHFDSIKSISGVEGDPLHESVEQQDKTDGKASPEQRDDWQQQVDGYTDDQLLDLFSAYLSGAHDFLTPGDSYKKIGLVRRELNRIARHLNFDEKPFFESQLNPLTERLAKLNAELKSNTSSRDRKNEIRSEIKKTYTDIKVAIKDFLTAEVNQIERERQFEEFKNSILESLVSEGYPQEAVTEILDKTIVSRFYDKNNARGEFGPEDVVLANIRHQLKTSEVVEAAPIIPAPLSATVDSPSEESRLNAIESLTRKQGFEEFKNSIMESLVSEGYPHESITQILGKTIVPAFKLKGEFGPADVVLENVRRQLAALVVEDVPGAADPQPAAIDVKSEVAESLVITPHSVVAPDVVPVRPLTEQERAANSGRFADWIENTGQPSVGAADAALAARNQAVSKQVESAIVDGTMSEQLAAQEIKQVERKFDDTETSAESLLQHCQELKAVVTEIEQLLLDNQFSPEETLSVSQFGQQFEISRARLEQIHAQVTDVQNSFATSEDTTRRLMVYEKQLREVEGNLNNLKTVISHLLASVDEPAKSHDSIFEAVAELEPAEGQSAEQLDEWAVKLAQIDEAYSEAAKKSALSERLPDRSALMQAYQNYLNAREHQSVNVTGKDASLDELLKQRRIDRLQEAETKLIEVYDELVAALGAAVSDAESALVVNPADSVDNIFVPDNLPTGTFENGAVTQSIATETVHRNFSPSSEAVAEVYKKFSNEWNELRKKHTEESSAYRAAVDEFYQQRAKGWVTGHLDKIKGAFGIKPKLPEDLQARREALFTLTAQYSEAAKRMRDLRPLKTDRATEPAVMERYLRSLARKQAMRTFEHQLDAQKEAWKLIAEERAAKRRYVGKRLDQAVAWATDPARARAVRIAGGAAVGGTLGFFTGGAAPALVMAVRAVAAGTASSAALKSKWVQRNIIDSGSAEKQIVADAAFKERTAALAEQLRDKSLTAAELQKIFAELEGLYARVDEAKRAEVLRLMSVAVVIGAAVGFSSTQAMAQVVPDLFVVPDTWDGPVAYPETPGLEVSDAVQSTYGTYTPEEIAAQQAVDGATNHAATGQEVPPAAAEGEVDAPPAVESFTVPQSLPIALEDDFGRHLNEWVDLKGVTLHGTADTVAKMQTEEFLSKQLPLAVKDIMAGEPSIRAEQLSAALSERVQRLFGDEVARVEVGEIAPSPSPQPEVLAPTPQEVSEPVTGPESRPEGGAAEAPALEPESIPEGPFTATLSERITIPLRDAQGVAVVGAHQIRDITITSPSVSLDDLDAAARQQLQVDIAKLVESLLKENPDTNRGELAFNLQLQMQEALAGSPRWGATPDLRIDVGSLTYEQYAAPGTVPAAEIPAPVEVPEAVPPPEAPASSYEPVTVVRGDTMSQIMLDALKGQTPIGLPEGMSSREFTQLLYRTFPEMTDTPNPTWRLTPAEWRELGLRSGNPNLIYPGEQINVNRLMEIVAETQEPAGLPLPPPRPTGLGAMPIDALDGADPEVVPIRTLAPVAAETLQAPEPTPRPNGLDVTPERPAVRPDAAAVVADRTLPRGLTPELAERAVARGDLLYTPENRASVIALFRTWPRFDAAVEQAAHQFEGVVLSDEGVLRDPLDQRMYGTPESTVPSAYSVLKNMTFKEFDDLSKLSLDDTREAITPRDARGRYLYGLEEPLPFEVYRAWREQIDFIAKDLRPRPTTTIGDLFSRSVLQNQISNANLGMQQNVWRP